MTPYREIFRLKALGLSVSGIARSVPCARNTVSRVLSLREKLNISWPIEISDIELQKLLFPGEPEAHPETAMKRNRGQNDQEVNKSYHDLSEYYNTAISPARVKKPKDKASVESTVGNITTYIIAGLRNERFFSIEELNLAIREKLDQYNNEPFQKREGSRFQVFQDEEKAYMRPLPPEPYHPTKWRKGKVQYDYHVPVEGMYYSVPYQYIKKEVEIQITDTMIEIYFNNNRIASHHKLTGSKNQRSTVKEHMPPNHQHYIDWNGDHYRKWAQEEVGPNCLRVVEMFLASEEIEQMAYKPCFGLVREAQKHSPEALELACEKCLAHPGIPSLSTIRRLLTVPNLLGVRDNTPKKKAKGITRGPEYYKNR